MISSLFFPCLFRKHCLFLMHYIVLIDGGKTTVVHLGFLYSIYWIDLRSLTQIWKLCGILVPLSWCFFQPLAFNGQFTQSMMQLKYIKVCAKKICTLEVTQGTRLRKLVSALRCVLVRQVFCRKSLFESVSCVSCASYFSILLTTNNEPFCSQNFTELAPNKRYFIDHIVRHKVQ